MTKVEGAANYSEVERQRLLAAVAELLSVRRPDRDGVATLYNALDDGCGSPRDAISLKRKFSALYRSARKATNRRVSTDEKAALELHQKLVRRAAFAMRQKGPNTSERCIQEVETPFHHAQATLAEAEVVISGSDASESVTLLNRIVGDRLASVGSELDVHCESARAPDQQSEPETTHSQSLRDFAQCDVLALFLWIKRRDERYNAQVLEARRKECLVEAIKQRQKQLECCKAEQRHRELLECIASLR